MMTFPTEQLRAGSVTDLSTLSGILLGGFLAFYAYIGFEDMVNIAEEIKRPERVLPIAILLALVISTLMYMAVSYAALSVLKPDQLGNSSAPLADVVVAKGLSSTWISLISIIAVINGAIVQLIMASRVIYGMARTQLLPTVLARVSVITATPIIATLCCITVTLLLALSFPLALLAQATSVVVLCIFTVVNVALIRINRLYPEDERRRYPVWIPYIGALLSIAMLLVKVVDLI
jgi:amino acid transporter